MLNHEDEWDRLFRTSMVNIMPVQATQSDQYLCLICGFVGKSDEFNGEPPTGVIESVAVPPPGRCPQCGYARVDRFMQAE